MKKWSMVLLALVVLAGCSSGTEGKAARTRNVESSEQTSESKESTEKSDKKKPKLVEKSFEINETAYKINILETWKEQPKEEAISLNVGSEAGDQALIAYGVSKADIESLEAFRNLITDQIASESELEAKQAESEDQTYQTAHYSGELYTFTDITEDIKMDIQYYFLETETDYVVINLCGFPSFFEKNEETITEILNSFVAG